MVRGVPTTMPTPPTCCRGFGPGTILCAPALRRSCAPAPATADGGFLVAADSRSGSSAEESLYWGTATLAGSASSRIKPLRGGASVAARWRCASSSSSSARCDAEKTDQSEDTFHCPLPWYRTETEVPFEGPAAPVGGRGFGLSGPTGRLWSLLCIMLEFFSTTKNLFLGIKVRRSL